MLLSSCSPDLCRNINSLMTTLVHEFPNGNITSLAFPTMLFNFLEINKESIRKLIKCYYTTMIFKISRKIALIVLLQSLKEIPRIRPTGIT
jgi:hypothetical protein